MEERRDQRMGAAEYGAAQNAPPHSFPQRTSRQRADRRLVSVRTQIGKSDAKLGFRARLQAITQK